jgi:hypothetical protein
MATRRWIGLVAIAVIAVGAWILAGSGRRSAPVSPHAPLAPAAPGAADGADAPVEPAARPAPELPPASGGTAAGDADADELGGDVIAAAWANVDLEEVRRALPNNLTGR